MVNYPLLSSPIECLPLGSKSWNKGYHFLQPVHRTKIQCFPMSSSKYLAYTSDFDGKYLSLWESNDLIHWTPNIDNPIKVGSQPKFRCPSVTYENGMFTGFFDDFTTLESPIYMWASKDGKSWVPKREVVRSGNNPFIWLNPNDNLWYLYFQQRSRRQRFIKCRIAPRLDDLHLAREETILSYGTKTIGAPSILYRDGLYWMLTEERPRRLFSKRKWITSARYSHSPIGPFKVCSNSPILTKNKACATHYLDEHDKLFVFYNLEEELPNIDWQSGMFQEKPKVWSQWVVKEK